MNRWIRRLEAIVPKRADDYGGKARGLAALARAGFPVPLGYAVSGEACETFVARVLRAREVGAAGVTSLLRRMSAGELESMAERVRRAYLPSYIVGPLREVYDDLKHRGIGALAVRSSSSIEDQASSSAAGLHTTRLQVTSFEELLSAVRDCWASTFDPKVMAYARHAAADRPFRVGVVIQAMVPADSSGVLFTANPWTGDVGEVVVNATYGLGAPLADGRVTPDTYRIDKATGWVRDRMVSDKHIRLDVTPTGSLRETEVDPCARKAEALDEATLQSLVVLGRRIEHHFGEPKDIEFAVSGGVVYVLQARPITTISTTGKTKARTRKPPRFEPAKVVWSNLNVGEALPGAATPLTWSVLSHFSEMGFRRAFGALGCSVPKDVQLVGNFRGRIYLNLTELTAIAAQVPGLRPRTLLALGGGGEIERLEQSIGSSSHIGFLMRLPRSATRLARENFALGRRVRSFERHFTDESERIRSVDLRVLPPIGLDRAMSDVERLLHEAGSIMLTCYGNLLWSVVALRNVLRLLFGADAERLERGLLSGLTEVETAAPALELCRIAEEARRDEAAYRWIAERDVRALRVEDIPKGPTQLALTEFLRSYGHRGVREAELAEPRWGEDPSLLFATLRLYWSGGGDESRFAEVERRRREAQERVSAEIERSLNVPARVAVHQLMKVVRGFVRLRERLRGDVTEVLGLFRAVALDVSRRLEVREPECGPGSAFFLTAPEIHSVLRGELEHVTLRVRQRRAQFARDRALPDPPSTFVGFPPLLRRPSAAVSTLAGLPASSGRVEGIARVLKTPSDAGALKNGEVLVVPYADIGWSPLFLVASALVADLGGPLSHAAVVAREYGLPAVFNVGSGTETIRTGDRVVVDGDAGTVELVEAAAAGRQGAPAHVEA